jgi:hypothetical protein
MSTKTWNPLFASDYGFTKPWNMFNFVRDAVVKRNESYDFFLAGGRGFGKSASAMSLAMMLDPDFTLDHWCFTTDKFLDLITTRQRPGTTIVWDEIGTQKSGSSRKWQIKEAHDLADIVQVNRTDGLIIIGTSIELSRGEKRFRSGYRVLADPVRKLSNQETGHGLAIDVEMRVKHTDVFEDETRYKLWRYASGGRIKYIRLYHPPVGIWQDYQGMRLDFLHDIKKKIMYGDDDKDDKPQVDAGSLFGE